MLSDEVGLQMVVYKHFTGWVSQLDILHSIWTSTLERISKQGGWETREELPGESSHDSSNGIGFVVGS